MIHMRRFLLLAILAASAHGQKDVHVDVRPDITTGTESTTQYPTIQMAMDHAPDAGPGPHKARVFVHIYPGVYHERVIVTQNRPRMTLIGMGSTPSAVVITNSLNAKQASGTIVP